MKEFLNFKTIVALLAALAVLVSCDNVKDDVVPMRANGNVSVADDQVATQVNKCVRLNLFQNDNITGQADISFTQPQHGYLSDSIPGVLMYCPRLNFTGTDLFTYTACVDGTCATATVTITVSADSGTVDPPVCQVVARPDYYTVQQGKTVLVNVLNNDDLCNATAFSILQGPAHGQASFTAGNEIIYTPHPAFHGTDELVYQVSGPNGTAAAKLSLVILPDSSGLPCTDVIARGDTAFIKIAISGLDTIAIDVLANDQYCTDASSPEPVISVVAAHAPTYGNVYVTGSGRNARLVYRNNYIYSNYTDMARYRLCQTINGQQRCSEALVLIQRY